MATKLRPAEAGLYERDFYAWSRRQAELLRARRFDDLDLEHLIDEVDDLGAAQYRSVRSRMRTIMEYLLKLQHSPAQEPSRGWYDTILAQRSELLEDLAPTLRQRAESELTQLYVRARHDVAASLRLHGEDAAAAAMPETCPYSFEQVLGDWLP